MKRPHILLVNPWIADFAAYDLWARPMGLLYVGKFLQKYGYQLQLLDLLDRNRWTADSTQTRPDGRGKYPKAVYPKPALLAHIPRKYGLYGATKSEALEFLHQIRKPAAVLLTSQMTYWYPGVAETARLIKTVFPDIPLILGGIYASLYPVHAKHNIQPDLLVSGYGEKRVLQYLDQLLDVDRDYTHIPDFNDSGILPWNLYENLQSAPILTSRGCPYHCTYCATRRLHPTLVQRNPRDVVNEIEHISEHFGIHHFAFYDDALFANPSKHIIPLLKQINAMHLSLHFHTPNGLFARQIDRQLAQLMKTTGFDTIRLSIEATQSRWQAASSHKVNNQSFLNAVDCLAGAGYSRKRIEAYIIMGLPGQTPDEVSETIRFVADAGIIARLASYSPIPATVTWDEGVQLGLLHNDMDPLLTNNSIYPCANEDFPVEAFQKLKQLTIDLNNQNRISKKRQTNG